jgi:hypothetical protein
MRVGIPWEYIYWVEADVACYPSWDKCFEWSLSRSEDLLCLVGPWEHQCEDTEEVCGWWYDNFTGNIDAAVPKSERLGCMMQTFRLSRAALRAIQEEVGKSYAYYEAYYPTLMKWRNLTVGGVPRDMIGGVFASTTTHDRNTTIENLIAMASPKAWNVTQFFHPVKPWVL